MLNVTNVCVLNADLPLYITTMYHHVCTAETISFFSTRLSRSSASAAFRAGHRELFSKVVSSVLYTFVRWRYSSSKPKQTVNFSTCWTCEIRSTVCVDLMKQYETSSLPHFFIVRNISLFFLTSPIYPTSSSPVHAKPLSHSPLMALIHKVSRHTREEWNTEQKKTSRTHKSGQAEGYEIILLSFFFFFCRLSFSLLTCYTLELFSYVSVIEEKGH